MTYSIVSARYANEEGTSAVAMTVEAAAVLVSERDTPDLWADLHSMGLTIADYEPPPEPFPSVVTAAQGKIALFNAGLLDGVKAIVAAHPYEIVRIWYADAGVWERGNAYVQALGVELGLDDPAIDELFVSASRL